MSARFVGVLRVVRNTCNRHHHCIFLRNHNILCIMTTHDSLSACHKALRCDDILEMIFGTLQPMKDYAPDRATCASCALVCRWFYEPAGRVLWEELRDLSPLWSILRPLPPVELTKGRLRERIIPEIYYNSVSGLACCHGICQAVPVTGSSSRTHTSPPRRS